jgi:hypothetical protein
MTRLFVSLILVGSSIASAQTKYALRQIDFQDPLNSGFVKPRTDNLAVILADAYLSGKLNAYSVPPLDSVIQALEFPKRSVRDAKAASKKKRIDRKKLFGKSKTMLAVTPADMLPLSKSAFLKQMTLLHDEAVQWDKATRYERGKGLVYYKGLGYFPKKDTMGIAPPNKAFWELAYNANLPFYFHIPALPAVSIFGQYVEVNKKSIWQPLLVRLTRTAEVPDYLVDMTVSFKYDEVMKYLATIGQPVLYQSPVGFVGNGTFVLTPEQRDNLKEQVRTQAISNAAFKSNITTSSMILFTTFLDHNTVRADGPTDDGFNFFQDPTGKEFRMFKGNVPVAVIPSGAIEQMLNFPKAELLTYSQALTADKFNTYEVTLTGLSSELPYNEVPATDANPSLRAGLFLEKYTISTVGATEQKRIKSRFTNLIKLVNAQFKAATLLPVEEKNSYFRARFDWSTIPEVKAFGPAINKAYWSNLLHHDDISDVRYPYYWSENANVGYMHKKLSPLRADSLEFGVTYKRTVPLAGGKSGYEPVQVSLKSMQKPGPDADFATYTFNFNDLKKAINKSKDPLLVELVKLVETAALPYTDSQIVYGLIEDEAAVNVKEVAKVKEVGKKKVQ